MTQALSYELPEFLTDGNNEVTASMGFIAGGSTSGEVFRTDIHASRNTSLYSATAGFEFTDECFALLMKGGIYYDVSDTFRIGATFVYNPLFMYKIMAEQNLVPGAWCSVSFSESSKLEIELGFHYKTERFYALPSNHNRVNNTTIVFSLYYKHLFDKLNLYGGLTSHTLYSYRLFLQPRWVLGAEYNINEHFSAGVNTALQYGDVFLSAYVDSFSMDISCTYKF